MFCYADSNGMVLSEEQIAAIYFHDIYYDIKNVGRSSNEEKSAEYAYKHMQTYFQYSDDRATLVKNIILDTETHIPTCKGDMSTPVIDLDLWFLYDFKEYKKVAWCDYQLFSIHKIRQPVSDNVGDETHSETRACYSPFPRGH